MGSGWLAKIDPSISFGRYFMQRAESITARNHNRDGMQGLRYPSNIKVYNIKSELMGDPFAHPGSDEILEAVYGSGSPLNTIRTSALDIGRAIYRFSTLDEIPSSIPTDEEVWENRLLIDAGVSDDEWVASADATDPQESSFIDRAIDRSGEHWDVMERFKNLPWDVLTQEEALVIRLHFGLNGEPPLGFEEIVEMLSLSKEAIQNILDEALGALKYPAERLGLEKAYDEFPLLVDRYAELTGKSTWYVAWLLGISERRLLKWIGGGKASDPLIYLERHARLMTLVSELVETQS